MDDPDGGTVTAVARLRARLDSAQPPLAWTLRGYRRDWLRGDLLAGVTVAALIVPLSIGYAQVAGLPPEAGLYASLVPLVAYAVFGSARRLIIGPDAATAALVAAAIVPHGQRARTNGLRLASALALLVAVVFVGMRLATLGLPGRLPVAADPRRLHDRRRHERGHRTRSPRSSGPAPFSDVRVGA